MFEPKTMQFLNVSELPDAPVFNRQEVLQELAHFVSQFNTQEEAARALEISRVFLWRILNNKKPPSTKVLEKLGFIREVRQAEFYFREKVAA
jgi:DNA invertase Pin-like site-specific DNA recombinase